MHYKSEKSLHNFYFPADTMIKTSNRVGLIIIGSQIIRKTELGRRATEKKVSIQEMK